jgi:hypothetical protein
MGASAKLPHLTKSVIKRSADARGTTMRNWLTYLKHRITYLLFLKIYGLFSLFFTKVVLTLGEGPHPHPLLLTLHRMFFSLGCAVQRVPLLDFSIGLPLLNNPPAQVAPRASPEIDITQQISFCVGICEIKKATRLVCALPRLCFSGNHLYMGSGERGEDDVSSVGLLLQVVKRMDDVLQTVHVVPAQTEVISTFYRGDTGELEADRLGT